MVTGDALDPRVGKCPDMGADRPPLWVALWEGPEKPFHKLTRWDGRLVGPELPQATLDRLAEVYNALLSHFERRLEAAIRHAPTAAAAVVVANDLVRLEIAQKDIPQAVARHCFRAG